MALTWQQSASVAAALFVIAVALQRAGAARAQPVIPFIHESFVVAGLYALWQFAGTLSVLGTSGAFERAHRLVVLEQRLHLPSEARVQHVIVDHPLLVQACNLYYATMHFGAMFVFLLWLFIGHRRHYARIRTTVAITTLVCLLLQFVPVAPPRLLPGFVDTARQYSQSVYELGLTANQLSAMPSVHVAWALLIGWAVVRVSPSQWRWLAIVHPLATVFVVTATANHFWLDGVVAALIVVSCRYGHRSVADTVRSRSRSAHFAAPAG